MWTQIFQQSGKQYPRAPVVIFTSGTQSGCGPASSATGPFYCPADHKVYLDLSFFQELSRRFGAPGDFAAAYVIAHEIGHHVQSALGIEDGDPPEAAGRPGPREPLLGPPGAPGRLLRRRLGALDLRPRAPRSGRHRGRRSKRRRRRRRRPARRAQPRAVDARLVRAPRAVVPHGVRLRQARRLRHGRRRSLARGAAGRSSGTPLFGQIGTNSARFPLDARPAGRRGARGPCRDTLRGHAFERSQP